MNDKLMIFDAALGCLREITQCDPDSQISALSFNTAIRLRELRDRLAERDAQANDPSSQQSPISDHRSASGQPDAPAPSQQAGTEADEVHFPTSSLYR